MQLQEISRQVEDTLRQANIKFSTIILSASLIIASIVSYPSMSRYKDQMDAVRQEVSVAANKTDKLERELELEKAQAAIANERYRTHLTSFTVLKYSYGKSRIQQPCRTLAA